MKYVLPALILSYGITQAQGNRLPLPEARRYAKACVEQLPPLTDAAIQTDVDVQKPCAETGEGGGAMIIPQKKLAKASLTARPAIQPLGQLWMRKWTLVANGKAVPDSQLRIIKPLVDEKERPMPFFLLGIRKKGGKNELLLYGKAEKPILVLPLKSVDYLQDLPLEIEWQRGEKQIDSLVLSIVGKYEVAIPITRQ